MPLYAQAQAHPELRAASLLDKCRKAGPFWQICWDEARSREDWRAYN
jgi:hypothetical protein